MGEVRDPQPVRRTGGELAFHQVSSPHTILVLDRGAHGLAAHGTGQTEPFHQPFHPTPTHVDVFAT